MSDEVVRCFFRMSGLIIVNLGSVRKPIQGIRDFTVYGGLEIPELKMLGDETFKLTSYKPTLSEYAGRYVAK